MNGIKKILVAVDESQRSGPVVEKAIVMAQSFAAKILLVNVHPRVLDLGQPYYQQLLNKYLEHAENTVAPHKVQLKHHEVAFNVLILEGDPAEMITETARVEKCDLIVIGTRGLSSIQGLALGSVSNKVLHATHCQVLMVP
jgi:nucleotide-binding universal stress UspA family protein